MPLEWKRGKNPYVYNFFGVLQVGPNTTERHINHLAKQLSNRIKAGFPPKLEDEELDDHQIGEARGALLSEERRALELLLVHPEIGQKKSRLKEVVKDLRQTAVLAESYDSLPLVHPVGIFWFLPQPEVDAAVWPPLEDFHLVNPGDDADTQFDIVFDS